jgi:nucleotide-binding universal stress UspA family protein
MIIIGYDGSEDAQAAADHVARLFQGKLATVVTLWEPYVATLATAGGGLASGFGVGIDTADDAAVVDAQRLGEARRTAEDGARRLRAAGMDAEALVEENDGRVARTVLAVAARVNAEAVVVGTRGRGRAKSALLGSVSHDLVQHADRALVVVPSAALARHRGAWLTRKSGKPSGVRCPPASSPQ